MELIVGVGRITPSFRRLFLDEVARLRRRFQPALRDLGHQEAFSEYIRDLREDSCRLQLAS